MAPRKMTANRHYNPLLITYLPKERRARNPHQFCTMGLIATYGASQLILGTFPGSGPALLGASTQRTFYWTCVIAGLLGLAAAIIPERVVETCRIPVPRRYGRRWRMERVAVDWTWFRLWEELSCHLILVTVWISLAIAALSAFGIETLPFSLLASIWYLPASAWRAIQIGLTMKHAIADPPIPSAILGAGDDTIPVDGESSG